MLFPIVGLDGGDYYDVVSYVEANQRFLERMGVDLNGVLQGLDGKPYNSALVRQRADEEFIKSLDNDKENLHKM